MSSQEWLPVGTQWTFDSSVLGQQVEDDIYTITGTEEIKGKICSKLEKTHFSCDLRPMIEYFYKDEGKLYCYDSELDEFLFFLDFSVNVGDTIKIPSYPQQNMFTNRDTNFMRIDSIFSKDFNGLCLKIFYKSVGYYDSNNELVFNAITGKKRKVFVEDIGYLTSFFNWIETGWCDAAYSTPLKSFSIPGFGTWDADELLSQNEIYHVNQFNVYPNPARNQILIKNLPLEYGSILITNTAGEIVKSIKKRNKLKSIKVDISQLPKGLYIVLVSDSENDYIHSKKIIKN